MKTIKVAIAGMGWFGRIHREAWASIPGVEVVACCDKDKKQHATNVVHAQDTFHRDAGQSLNEAATPEVPMYEDLKEMLSNHPTDLLDVVTTESTHYEVARQGLEAGVNVLVEKPFVLSSEHSRELIELARRAGKQLFAGLILRFDSRYMTMHEEIASSNERQVRHMSLERHFQVSSHEVYGRIHPYLGACIHDIDVAIWFKGGAPSRVMSSVSHLLGKDHPDIVTGILEWDDGAKAVIQNAWHVAHGCPFGFQFDSKILTSDGTWIVRNEPAVHNWTNQQAVYPEIFFWPKIDGRRQGAIHTELSHFAESVRCERPSYRVPMEQVHAGILTAEALIRSSQTRSWEKVSCPKI